MSAGPHVEPLTRAMDRAVADHFGDAGRADPEQVMVAACTVAGSHIARVHDPIALGVLLAQAQWTLGRVVAEVVKTNRAKAKPGGGRSGGT